MKHFYSAVSFVALASSAQAVTQDEVLETYSNIALAGYEDSLETAQALKTTVEALISEPTEENLAKARAAWVTARAPYQQTEVYRFGNSIVDEWEGRVNAWPLDEGLIDYVESGTGDNEENPYAAANIIANPVISVSGQSVDASEITPELIQSFNEFEGIEANVATGYHAIEFLLWGQDLHGTEAGAGERPASDFDVDNCTHENCDRRAAYLQSATDLLISDLEEMVANWGENGEARLNLLENPAAGMSAIFTGMGSLSYGEVAGQRMKLGLMLHDPEEEHDCFSDNTHMSHYFDGLGVQNVWLGHYKRIDGSSVEGASPYDLIAASDQALADAMSADLETTMNNLDSMVDRAQNVEAYDQMLAPGNREGAAVIQTAIDSLIAQTRNIERVAVLANAGEVTIEGSDSLDNPNAVFE